MKIFIIHGDHTQKSYERLQKYLDAAKKRGWEIEHLTDKNQSLREALISQSLFSAERLIVVENFNLVNKKDLLWLKKEYTKLEATLIVYHPSALTKRAVNSFPKVNKIEEFKLPKLIWRLIDSISPGNEAESIGLLHQVLETESEEFVFAVIAKQFRDLYWVKEDPAGAKLFGWQKEKLIKQSTRFDTKSLFLTINALAEADVNAKTSVVPLRQSLDFIFATKLQ